MRGRFIVGALLVAVISGAPLRAQDAGSLLRDRQRPVELKFPDRIPDPSIKSSDDPSQVVVTSGTTAFISRLVLKGDVELLRPAQRKALGERIEGTQAGLSEVFQVAEDANTFLRQNGHLLAEAVIPPQDLTEGSLIVEIISGSLEDIEVQVQGDARVRPSVLRGIADRFVKRDALNQLGLETALLRINDLPGVTAQSRLTEGATPGTSRLIIDAAQAPVLSASLQGDNFGSPSTGRWQSTGQLAFADVTGGGDATRVAFSISEGQRFLSAGLALPLTAGGLSFSADYGYLDYKNIDPIGRLAGLNGEAHFGSVGLAYQAIRTRRANLVIQLSAHGAALVDEASAGRLADKRIWSGRLSFTADLRDRVLGGGVTQLSVMWTRGDLDLSRLPTAELIDALTLQRQGSYNRINANLVRVQSLSGQLSLLLRAAGQWASQNLDPFEGFFLGGPFAVRAWPVGEGRGDMGVHGTAELRNDFTLSPSLGVLQLIAFVDAGHVQVNKRTFGIPPLNACQCNDYALAGAGLGLSWQHERFTLSGSWAHGLGRNPGRSALDGTNVDGTTSRQQFWLTAAIQF